MVCIRVNTNYVSISLNSFDIKNCQILKIVFTFFKNRFPNIKKKLNHNYNSTKILNTTFK